MDTATVALLGAAIGAGGAVAAQSVASYFSSRHDTKRLNWERHTQETEWANQKAGRFLDQKREAYSNYAAMVDAYLAYIGKNMGETDIEGTPELPDITKFGNLLMTIELIAPESLQHQRTEIDTQSLCKRECPGWLTDQGIHIWRAGTGVPARPLRPGQSGRHRHCTST